MKVFENKFKVFVFPLYYLIHNNIFFGLIQKYIFKVFKYRNFRFDVQKLKLPIGYYSSFLWKTYELNDRIVLQKNLSNKNKCIIIGGGIGFIGVLSYHITKNKILIFEINNDIIKLLKNNLKVNKVKNKIFKYNLILKKSFKKNFYFDSINFLTNSIYRNTDKKVKFENIFYKKIPELKNFNTLIIDGEGIEDHYISNISKLKNIRYLFFEFHNDILDLSKKKKLFNKLKKNKFIMKYEFINSFYFEKIS